MSLLGESFYNYAVWHSILHYLFISLFHFSICHLSSSDMLYILLICYLSSAGMWAPSGLWLLTGFILFQFILCYLPSVHGRTLLKINAQWIFVEWTFLARWVLDCGNAVFHEHFADSVTWRWFLSPLISLCTFSLHSLPHRICFISSVQGLCHLHCVIWLHSVFYFFNILNYFDGQKLDCEEEMGETGRCVGGLSW